MAEAMFWVLAAAILVACVAAMLGALRARGTDSASPDIEVYRDQLRELERDAARGTLGPQEAEGARAEVARRLLAADAAARPARAVPRHRWLGAALVSLPVIALSLVTYFAIGAPGYADLPLADRIAAIEAARAARPGQAAAEAELPAPAPPEDAETAEMAARLKAVLRDRPDDLEGWRLAVRTQVGLGDYPAAWRSQARVIAILGDAATGTDAAIQGELMVIAANGYVSPEAETAFARAARDDPGNGTARYYAGLMYAQQGRPDRAFPIWRALLADSTPDAPWLDAIYGRIERVSVAAGDPTPLAELPVPTGPSAADVAASEAMTPEARVEMVRSMVDGLSARLASQGGPATDWARLITAFGVLARSTDAAAVYAEARAVFADDPAALDILARAAERAGVSP